MNKRIERLDRIKAAEREFDTADAAIQHVERILIGDPRQARTLGIDLGDLRELSANLEATYLIRLFAEFESALRAYWKDGRKRKSKPPTELLIASIATLRNIPQDCVDEVQRVRRLRNGLVHEDVDKEIMIAIGHARKHLCYYISYLPLSW